MVMKKVGTNEIQLNIVLLFFNTITASCNSYNYNSSTIGNCLATLASPKPSLINNLVKPRSTSSLHIEPSYMYKVSNPRYCRC